MRLVLLAGSLAASASAASSSSGGYCTVTDQVVLTTCDACVTQDQGCVQYPTKAADKCSAAARNACKAHDASCTYQCLNVYQGQSGKWTLFIKTPEATDAFVGDPNGTFPVAPVQRISGLQVPELANAIQIAGFTSVNSVPKGSTKTLVLDNNFFANAQSVNSLAVANINLAQLQTNFLPKTLSTLVMDNCALTDVPYDVRSMQSLTTLNLTSNNIVELPSADSTTFKGIQGLTSLSVRGNALTSFNWVLPSLTFLDLGNNKLTAFPTSIFNMTKLTTVILDGNDIKATTLTSAQFSFFKRLSATSSLGFSAAPGSCGTGEREDSVLGAVVCVSDASNGSGSTTTPKSSSSSNLGLIIGIVAAAVVVLAVGGFLVYRRRSKTNSQFYDAVMDNRSGTGTRSGGSGTRSGAPGGNYNHTGNNTGASATGESRGSLFGRMRGSSTGRRSSVQGNRPSRANSSGSRPSLAGRPSKTGANSSVYAEIGKYQEERQTGTATGGTSSLAVGGSRQRERAQINKNVVRISSEDINYTRTIAKGAFGEVWLAHYGRDLVAVKKLLSTDPSSVGDFIAELNLLASLSHPRILALIGACWDDNQSDLQIVTEYMDSGDLLTVLRRSSPRELTWEKHKATYCVQVCEAVFYLHSLQPALIHRDIKSRNILIDERKGAKLSDFGESRERTIQNTMTAGVGTARWVAPEIILGEDYSELADIYSLGVLLTELDTHKIPFESLNLEEHMIVQQVAVGKLRPTVSDTCPEVIRRLAHECLQFDPQLRPSAARVLQTLMASPLIRRLSTISDNE